MGDRKLRRARSLSLALLACDLAAFGSGRGRWTELNIGPFYVDTDSNTASARDVLAGLEQTRWVMAGLLDDANLTTTWPVRIFVTTNAPHAELGFVSAHGERLFFLRPGEAPPLGTVAGFLLDDNTPRLPEDVESGIRQLFNTMEVKGSRVNWGAKPAHPDLAASRMALFATKFEYSASFHIFLTSLKNGSTLRAAESNAFGQPAEALEREAESKLQAGRWESVSVTGRPLDPKRDFGEHSFNDDAAKVYLAATEGRSAEATYKASIPVGGTAVAAAYEGLAQLAMDAGQDPTESCESAVKANSRSAPIYLCAAKGAEGAAALALVKQAERLNARWAEPLVREAELAKNPADRESLLAKAVQLNRREPKYYMALAAVQADLGHATAAQGSWIRAEDAAPEGRERDQVHQQRLSAEAHRLDAAAAAREADENAAYQADQKAQRAQAAKIRAAERQANHSVASEAGEGAKDAETAMTWKQLVPEKKADGSLTRVDCLGSNARLEFKDRSGGLHHFLWRNTSELGIACGVQQPPLHVSITYSAQPDEESRTDGAVSTVRVWPNSSRSR